MPVTVKIAKVFFLLGIHADDRIARGLIVGFELIDVLKLCIAM